MYTYIYIIYIYIYIHPTCCAQEVFPVQSPRSNNASATGASGDANAVQQGETLAVHVGVFERGMIIPS